MSILRRVAGLEDRGHEKQNILGWHGRYLFSDVHCEQIVEKGHSGRISQIETSLGVPQGLILDIRAGSCGEAEYLANRGYSVIATDTNEVALSHFQKRCAKFQTKRLTYLACHEHHLPIRNESIESVVLNQSLQNMDDSLQVLKEVSRVLAPGGRVYLNDPWAYYTSQRLAERLSEICSRTKRTSKRKREVAESRKLLRESGLGLVSIRRHAHMTSDSKVKILNIIRKRLRMTYDAGSKICPSIFGDRIVVAEKTKRMSAGKFENSFELILRCPVTGSRLVKVRDQGYLSLDHSFRGFYPSQRGIPVLISNAAKRVDFVTWENLISINFLPTL